MPRQWLPPFLALGLFGLRSRLARRLPAADLDNFRSRCWACSAPTRSGSRRRPLWAAPPLGSGSRPAELSAFLLFFALALLFFTDPTRPPRVPILSDGRRGWSARGLFSFGYGPRQISPDLFIENRLSYPVSYPNNAAALFLIAFWPLMWLASGPEERAPVRGISLGLATGVLSLAIMTQSRGAVWSLGISLVIMFIVSPARIRALLYLLVPALLMMYEFPNLNRYWIEGPQSLGGRIGGSDDTGCLDRRNVHRDDSRPAGEMGQGQYADEGAIRHDHSPCSLGGAVYGSVALTQNVGGPFAWISQAWKEFSGAERQADQGTGTRFSMLYSSGRVPIWGVAWKEFEGAPVLGVGADNFIFDYDRLREVETVKPQQAHSIELQVLGETGVIGGLFAFGGMLLAMGGILWPRCASPGGAARRNSGPAVASRLHPKKGARKSARACGTRAGETDPYNTVGKWRCSPGSPTG